MNPKILNKGSEIKRLRERIGQLEMEADAFEEYGSNFSAACLRDEAERLEKYLKSLI